MKCPVCNQEYDTSQEQCPHCRADVSLSHLIAGSLARINSETEALLQQKPFHKETRLKLQQIRQICGQINHCPAQPVTPSSPKEKLAFLLSADKVFISGAIGMILAGVIGFMSLRNFPAPSNWEAPDIPAVSLRAVQPGAAPQVNQKPAEAYVIVRKGDSLWRLSRELFHSENFTAQFAAANGLHPGEPIYPGQKLKMPAALR